MPVDARTYMKMKNTSRLKLACKVLLASAQLWFLGLALRMGAPAIEFFVGERPRWLKWIYTLPRAFPKDENARWFQYWPLLLPLAMVAIAGVFQWIAEIKAGREEQIYRDENRN